MAEFGGLDFLNASLPSYGSSGVKSDSGFGATFTPGSLSLGFKGYGSDIGSAFSDAFNTVSGQLSDAFSPSSYSSYSSSGSGSGDFWKQALLATVPAAVGTVGSYLSNRATNETNLQIASANLDYQRAYNDMIFAREDNAVQRRANDLQLAGLSKTLAAGSAAGAGGSANVPQLDYERSADVMTPQLLAQLGTQAIQNSNTLLTMYQTAKANQADLRLKELQAQYQALVNASYAENSNLDAQLKSASIKRAKLDYDVLNHDFLFAKRSGLMHGSNGLVHDTLKTILGLDDATWKMYGDKLSNFGNVLWSSLSGKYPDFNVGNLFNFPAPIKSNMTEQELAEIEANNEIRRAVPDSTPSYVPNSYDMDDRDWRDMIIGQYGSLENYFKSMRNR